MPPDWVGKSLFELLVDRTVKPAQMQIVREILTDNSTTDVDMAVFNDIQTNYTISPRPADRDVDGDRTPPSPTRRSTTAPTRCATSSNCASPTATVSVALLLDRPFDGLNITFANGDVGTLTRHLHRPRS